MQEEKSTNVVFSERLDALIKSKGVTQKDVAAALEISQAGVSRWLNGSVPAGDILYRLSKFFNVSMEYFFEETHGGKLAEGGRGVAPPLTASRDRDVGKAVSKLRQALEELEKKI